MKTWCNIHNFIETKWKILYAIILKYENYKNINSDLENIILFCENKKNHYIKKSFFI